MNAPDAILADLSESALHELATAVQAGWLSGDSPAAAFTPLAGQRGAALADWLLDLETHGFTPSQIARLIRALISGRCRDRILMPDLVVSGPEVPGVPTTDTYATVQSMFQQAQREIILAGYAFHNGKLLFERLAAQKALHPELRILFHVDVPRRAGDTSAAESIILRYAADFHERHWPWKPRPEIYFDPRALQPEAKQRASLHAKAVVVDRRQLLLTSANFTEAAHQRNIEMGLLSNATYLAEQVASYFEALRTSGQLQRLPDT